MTDYNFSAQYQQNPQPLSGFIVKREWLKFYSPAEKPERFDQILQSWDTANKDTELSNFSVCTTWGIKDQRLFLLDVHRRRMDFPTLKRAVIDLATVHRADIVLVEDKASGISLIAELRSQNFSIVQEAPSIDGDKVMRLRGQTAKIANGFVLFPKDAHWLDTYLLELVTFPNSKNDDHAQIRLPETPSDAQFGQFATWSVSTRHSIPNHDCCISLVTPRRSRGMEPTVRNPRIKSAIGFRSRAKLTFRQPIPGRRRASKSSRQERNFWMQRPEPKNPPERPLCRQRPGNVENRRQDPRRNGLFSIEDGFRGSGRLGGGVRSRMRTRLSGDSTLETAAIRCFPLSLVKTGNSNPKDFGFRACYP